ncbi:MAG: alpha/beta hydrolase [Planctomycetota bacterium]|nr:alpha/beta hydrolase [Planctomycetota bacterium]
MDQLGYITAPDGSPLYAAYHAPVQGSPASPVLICAPLFEERKSAYGALRKLAGRLAAAGRPVLRFDYRGSGESGGSSAARRWSHMAEDLAAAREALTRISGAREVVLLGLRLGGTLALQEALRGTAGQARSGTAAVIALAPVSVGSHQVRQWKMRSQIRAELTTGGGTGVPPVAGGQDAHATLDFDGYDVHPAFFDDVAAIDLHTAGALSCPALVVQISHRTEPAGDSTKLVAALGPQARLECLRLEPFWEKLDDVDTGPLEDIVLKQVPGF